MNFKGLVWLGLGVVLCLGTACHHQNQHKQLSPEAARKARADWNIKTLVEAYNTVGNTDAKWDAAATNALAEFAQWRAGTDDTRPDLIIATNCAAAIQAGCDDPMVRYLYLLFGMSPTNKPEDFSAAFPQDGGRHADQRLSADPETICVVTDGGTDQVCGRQQNATGGASIPAPGHDQPDGHGE